MQREKVEKEHLLFCSPNNSMHKSQPGAGSHPSGSRVYQSHPGALDVGPENRVHGNQCSLMQQCRPVLCYCPAQLLGADSKHAGLPKHEGPSSKPQNHVRSEVQLCIPETCGGRDVGKLSYGCRPSSRLNERPCLGD